jgi:cytochrome c-type biogenesis protein CcmE
VQERKTKSITFLYTEGMTEQHNLVEVRIFDNSELGAKLGKSEYVLIKNARQQPGQLTLNKKSQVFATGPWVVMEEKLLEYRNSPRASTAEVLKSPAKRRVTVVGVVKDEPMVDDRKKKFKLNDDYGVVEVQFLGIDKDVVIETGQNMVFKNLMVSVYENRTTLTNTANTMVENAEDELQIEKTIKIRLWRRHWRSDDYNCVE